jgi:hypothetical protein
MGLDLTGGHAAMDYAEHARTYKGFIKGTITLIVIVALTLVGMFLFLA